MYLDSLEGGLLILARLLPWNQFGDMMLENNVEVLSHNCNIEVFVTRIRSRLVQRTLCVCRPENINRFSVGMVQLCRNSKFRHSLEKHL